MTTVRRAGTASAAVLTGLVAALGLARAAAPEWTHELSLDFWNANELYALVRATADRRENLQSEQELLYRQIEATDHLATRLAAGVLSLAEAADEGEPLLRGRPGFATVVAARYRAPSMRASVCRYLIDRVARMLASDPAQRESVLKRLETEYSAIH